MLADHELVGRGSCSVLAGVYDKRPTSRQMSFPAKDRLFNQSRRREVPEDRIKVVQSVIRQLEKAGQLAGLLARGRRKFQILRRVEIL